AGQPVTVPVNAESLLLTSHPDLTGEQRRRVLELTAIDSGYPLDSGNTVAGWQRLNLAAAMSADVIVNADGTVSLADDVTPAPVPDPADPGTSPEPTDPGTSPEPTEPGTTPEPTTPAGPVELDDTTPAAGADSSAG